MKLGKKKLVFSTLCLIAALSLAVFTVYAWLIQFKNVATTGIKTQLASGDVISCDISYYYTTSKDGTSYTLAEQEITPEGSEQMTMNDFVPVLTGDEEPTAVLMHLRVKFARPGNYYLLAKATHTDVYGDTFQNFIKANYLSNVVYFQRIAKENINLENRTFSIDEEETQYSFIMDKDGANQYFDSEDDASKKNSSVKLLSYPVAEGKTGENEEHDIYYLLDYMPQQISSMYTVMLELFPKEADWNTLIHFKQDLIFEIGKN